MVVVGSYSLLVTGADAIREGNAFTGGVLHLLRLSCVDVALMWRALQVGSQRRDVRCDKQTWILCHSMNIHSIPPDGGAAVQPPYTDS